MQARISSDADGAYGGGSKAERPQLRSGKTMRNVLDGLRSEDDSWDIAVVQCCGKERLLLAEADVWAFVHATPVNEKGRTASGLAGLKREG